MTGVVNNRQCRICEKDFHVRPSRIRLGRQKYCSKKCWRSDVPSKKKLTFAQVCEIRERYQRSKRGAGIVKTLAAEYGIHPVSMYRITGGQAWKV